MINSDKVFPKRQESLNSDGQQFHQYHYYEQSTLTSNHWTYKRPRHMTLEI